MTSHPKLTMALAILATSLWGYLAIPYVQAQREPSPRAVPAARPSTDATTTSAAEAPPAYSLKDICARLQTHSSIRADLKQLVTVGARQFQASGIYVQASDRRIRMELQYELNDYPAGLLEVCDGQVLWSRQTIGKEVSYTRRDVQGIFDECSRLGISPQSRDSLTQLGMGGLPALLASLERNMDFTPPEEKQINGHPFLVLAGAWKPVSFKKFQGFEKRNPEVLGYLPDQVLLYLDKDTLFPRRIQYLKLDPDSNRLEPQLTYSLLNVVLNGGIERSEFEFVPPDGVIPSDTTQQYIPKSPAPTKNATATKPKSAT